MFKFSSLVAAANSQSVWTTGSGGINTLEAVSGLEMQLNVAHLEVNDEGNDGSVSLHVPDWSQLEVAGEPDLPILRASMALPRGVTNLSGLRAVAHSTKTEMVPLSTWGESIEPSKGKCPLCEPCNATAPVLSAYAGKYPAGDVVTIQGIQTWRDVHYVTVEVQPVSVDHSNGVAEVLRSCSIKLEGLVVESPPEPLGIEPGFHEAYKFFFLQLGAHCARVHHERAERACPGGVRWLP